jgi:hypothetical protein
MKLSAVTLALCLAAASAAVAQSQPAAAPKQGDPLVLRGCVAAGAESGTFVVNNVYEVDSTGAEKVAATQVNPILYWFKDGTNLAPHVGRRVEIAGKVDGLESTEIELKEGTQKDGGLVIEIEGPGRDVRASTSALPGVAGTTGTTPEKNDVKATIIKVTMGHLQPTEGSCN